MKIKIRYGFSNLNNGEIALLVLVITIGSLYASSHFLGDDAECPGIDTRKNHSNITLPSLPPFCPSFLKTCFCVSISPNGTEIFQSCISPRNHLFACLSTIIMYSALIVLVRKIFTVEGQYRVPFLYVIRSLFIFIFTFLMILMFQHDCYHRLVNFVGVFSWGILGVLTIRAYHIIRNRWEARRNQDGWVVELE